MAEDTIYALSSGPGRSAIAVIRLSGPQSHEIVRDITQPDLPELRCLVRRDIFGRDGQIIDEAMICLFPAGKSFTGDAMAEIHCHGSLAIIHQISSILGGYPGCRAAEPGEFSLRAFKSGRMDLAEVEGLADLISAQTEQQRREAMRLVRGEASRRTDHWRENLIHALALLEVTIDWADEEVPENVAPEVRGILTQTQEEFQAELDLAEQSEKLRNGFSVAILGAPNVGKSTLINALSGRDAAITSDVPGTTRDIIEVAFDLNGLPVRFLDTAGLRVTEDSIEAEGVARARRAAKAADLRIFLHASDVPEEINDSELWRDGDLKVQTKIDLNLAIEGFGVSAKTGDGLQALLDKVSGSLGDRYQSFGLFGHERRRNAIEKARDGLAATLRNLGEADIEIVAEDLRSVLFYLDSVIGRVGVEDVLGSVFSRFCLGK